MDRKKTGSTLVTPEESLGEVKREENGEVKRDEKMEEEKKVKREVKSEPGESVCEDCKDGD